ncbi:MAG TPA: hypothetical protein VJ732_04185 [Bryobacteraceae bacterium]|nr:hypothetical protein [Bryobacteraceae bacterium]
MRALPLLFLTAVAALAQPAPANQQPAPAQAPATPAPAAETPNPAPPAGEWFTASIDLGYRYVTGIGGNSLEYRSVVDLRNGPRVFGFDFTASPAKNRFVDRLDARASGWGGDPYSTAHLDARKLGVYDFDFDYRNIAYFDAVPSFANPFAPSGVDQQTFDTRRRMLSADLDLLPGKHVVPYLAFDRDSGHGHGIDTFVQEATDAFPVPILLRDSTDNYRGGVRFEYSRFHVTLEQGGTTFKDDDRSSYNGAPNYGDFTTPLLGQSLELNTLQQAYGIRGDSIYSKVLVTANPSSWLDLYGQFLYSQPRVDVNYFDTATGNFLSLTSLLLYSGEMTMGTGAANQPHTSANLGFVLRPLRRLRIVESWMTDRYHDAASPIVAEELAGRLGSGVPITTALNYTQVVNYNREQLDILYDLTSKITLRAGYRYVWGDASVLAGQLSQTGPIVPGKLGRNVGLAGLTFRPSQKFSVNLDYEGAASDHIYFRTSLNDYHQARVRARYQATSSLSVQTNFLVLNNQNPDPAIRYDFQSRDNSLSLYWTPNGGKRVSLMAEYDRSTLRSDIGYLLPPFLTQAVSQYRENAHTATTAVDLTPPAYGWFAPKVTFGGSLFISSGSRPSRYYQPMTRLSIPVVKHVNWNSEWDWYGFSEPLYLYEAFRTHVLMTGLRLTK